MIIVCASCGAKNRVPEEKLAVHPNCGQCHQALLTLAPIELNEQNLFSINIYSVPHPGCAWWNKKSSKYGMKIGTNINRTGRERFIDIITSKI